MSDFWNKLEKFKEIKDVSDVMDEIVQLRHLYSTRQYQEMMRHIADLQRKHFFDAMLWNAFSPLTPTTFHEMYLNADNFLQAVCAKLIVNRNSNSRNRLSEEERAYYESLIKSMGL